MAYKFRKDLAILSGALDQEGPITIKDDAGNVTVELGSLVMISLQMVQLTQMLQLQIRFSSKPAFTAL